MVQSDTFNRSRIATTVVCLITSNLIRSQAPGNVALRKGDANLPKASVVNVSQVVTLDKSELKDCIGRVPNSAIDSIRDGLKLLFEYQAWLEYPPHVVTRRPDFRGSRCDGPERPGQPIRAIYLEGIATGNATFEKSARGLGREWDRGHLSTCRLVARTKNEVLGCQAAHSARYQQQTGITRGVAEASIYVAARARGKGVGRALYLGSCTSESRRSRHFGCCKRQSFLRTQPASSSASELAFE